MKLTDTGFILETTGREVECDGTIVITTWGGVNLGVPIDQFIESDQDPANYTAEEKAELAEYVIRLWCEYANETIAWVEIRKFE